LAALLGGEEKRRIRRWELAGRRIQEGGNIRREGEKEI